MQEALHGINENRRSYAGFWLLVSIVILAVDRVLKQAVNEPGFTPRSLLPGIVNFKLFKNPGIAFSISLSGPLVWTVSLLILGWSVLTAWRDWRRKSVARFPALSLFAIGAASNLYDRIAYGYTVDYLIFFERSAVNLADGMILAGVLLLLFAGPERNEVAKGLRD